MYKVHSKEPIRRTRDGGSEWEPVKIQLENSAYEPKNHSNASVHFSCQIHVATKVLPDLGARPAEQLSTNIQRKTT
jgi:hypothetical protein